MSASKDLLKKELAQSESGTAPSSVISAAFLQGLYQFLKQTEVHDPSNKMFDIALKQVLRPIENLIQMPGQSGITFTYRGELFFINGVRLRPKPRYFYVYRFLLKFLRQRKLGGFRILQSPTEKNLSVFLWAVAKIDKEVDPAREVNDFLRAQGIKEFEIESTAGRVEHTDEENQELGDIELIVATLYRRIQKFVEVCFDNRGRAKEFQMKPVQESLNELALLAEEDLVQMLRLISVKRYDRPLPYRATNACFLMMAWARALRLPVGVAIELAGTALAHPLALLSEGKDDMVDFTLRTSQVIESLQEVWPLNELQKLAVMEWSLTSKRDGVHEVDGVLCYSHFFSRMVRIVALFEQFTTYEQGQRTFLPEEAMSEMMKREDLDATLLKLFINWLGVYPVGTFVQLQSGEIGQVFAGASDPLRFQRPIVMILKTSSGQLLERPELLDLSDMNPKLGVYKKSIKKSLLPDEAQIPESLLQMMPVGI
jgi:hypothetical protein